MQTVQIAETQALVFPDDSRSIDKISPAMTALVTAPLSTVDSPSLGPLPCRLPKDFQIVSRPLVSLVRL